MQDSWRQHWRLTLLYPLAALLVLLSANTGSLPDFGRDWRYVVGGPLGVLAWWLFTMWERSWPGLIAGYVLGAVTCAVIVAALGVVADRVRRDWD